MTSILKEAAAGRVTIVPWTLDQYHRALRDGLLADDPSVELLDGLIVQKDRAKAGDDRTTIGDRHRVAVLRLAQLAPAFERFGCFLQTQQPITLPPSSEARARRGSGPRNHRRLSGASAGRSRCRVRHRDRG